MANPTLTQQITQAVKAAIEKATDVRDKGVSGEFNPETVQSEMSKYLTNAQGSELKTAMDQLEADADKTQTRAPGASPVVDQFKTSMRGYMAKLFEAAQQMISAAVAEAQAKGQQPGSAVPTSGLLAGQLAPGQSAPGKPQQSTQKPARRSDPFVLAVQKYLASQGGKITMFDGVDGRETKAAVLKWQQDWNADPAPGATLPENGQLDDATMAAIRPYIEPFFEGGTGIPSPDKLNYEEQMKQQGPASQAVSTMQGPGYWK